MAQRDKDFLPCTWMGTRGDERVKRGEWLLRGLIVLVLAAVITLGVLVQPLEPPPPTPVSYTHLTLPTKA